MTVSELVDVIGEPGLKRATLTWKPSPDQYDQPTFACFLAIDDVE